MKMPDVDAIARLLDLDALAPARLAPWRRYVAQHRFDALGYGMFGIMAPAEAAPPVPPPPPPPPLPDPADYRPPPRLAEDFPAIAARLREIKESER